MVAFEVWAKVVVIESLPPSSSRKKGALKRTVVDRYYKGPFARPEDAAREAERLTQRWGHVYFVRESLDGNTERAIPESECTRSAGGGGKRSLFPDADAGSWEEPSEDIDDRDLGHIFL